MSLHSDSYDRLVAGYDADNAIVPQSKRCTEEYALVWGLLRAVQSIAAVARSSDDYVSQRT